MDKQLLKAYVRTIVEDEIRRVLPEVLSEAITELKQIKENTTPTQKSTSKIDRARLAELMGIKYDGNTLMATTDNVSISRLPENAPTDVSPEVLNAVTKNYSALMKKMGIV